jgi:hypothetical protein
MDTRRIGRSEVDQWEQYVEENPTIAWQTYYWSHMLRRHYPMEFHPVAAFMDNSIKGIMPLYIVKGLKGKTNIISVPFAVGGGITADNSETEQALVKYAIALYKEKRANRVIFKQYKHRLDGDFSTDDNYYNKELDLTVGPEKLFHDISEVNQKHVREADPYETRLVFPSEDINGFYKLLLVHHRNHGIPCVSKRWIQDLIGFKMYRVALLLLENDIVAGTLVKEHKQTVSFPFTATPDTSAKSDMFAYQLYWKLIRKFSMEGKAIFHSGRIPKNNTTHGYRLGWGGQKHLYYYQYYPNTGGDSHFKAQQSAKRKMISSVWKKLPLGVTALLGPKIVRYFP